MDYYRSLRRHFRQVQSGEINPEILAYSLQPTLGKLYIWYSAEDFKELSSVKKALHYSIAGAVYLLWISVSINLTVSPKGDTSIAEFCASISILLGGVILSFRMVDNWRTRAKLSDLTGRLNDKVQEVKATGTTTRRLLKGWNQNYLLMLMLMVISLAVSIPMLTLWVVYMLVTGCPIVAMSFPKDHPDYSLASYGLVAYQGVILMYSPFYYTLCETVLLDCILQLTFLYRVTFERMSQISSRAANAEAEMKRCFGELQFLSGLHSDFLEIIWRLTNLMWSICYILIGLSAVCLVLEMRTGLTFASVALVCYSAFVLVGLATWCIVASHFEDNVASLNSALFHSDWMDASLSFRKLVIVMMSFGQQTPLIQAAPFFALNRQSFAKLLNNVYTFYNLFRNVYLE